MQEFTFNALVTLLVVVDPLGLAPIFAALTRGFSEKNKRASAIRGTLLGSAILFLFALAGDVLLEALGIGLPAFRIAGGILLFLLALDMIFARPSGMRLDRARARGAILPAGHLGLPARHPATRRTRRDHDGSPIYRW